MILSVCIPTFNRAGILDRSCRQMLRLPEFDSEVELVVCDNCSTDGTASAVEALMRDFPDKNIVYHRNEENVRDKNFYLCLTFGTGLYRKLINDYTYITADGLREMKEAVLRHRDEDCSLLFGGDLKKMGGRKMVEAQGPDALVQHLYHHLTWISNFGVYDRDLPQLEPFLDRWSSQLLQVYWILSLGESKPKTCVYDFAGKYGRTPMPDSYRVPYNVFTALVRNYYDILYSFRDRGLISASTLRRDKTRALNTFVGWCIRDLLILKECSCYQTEEGMTICRKYFGATPYFYFLYLKAAFKQLRKIHWVRGRLFLEGHILNPLWLSRKERRVRRDAAYGRILENYLGHRLLPAAQCVLDTAVSGKFKQTEGAGEGREKIFSIWFQSEANAPDLIKSCFASMRQRCGGELIVLDEKTIFDYIELPEPIVAKFRAGKIKYCHFADICRVELLYKYGGWWIDSTCFMLSDFPEYAQDSDFFVYMAGNEISGNYSFIQNCFIRAKKCSILLAAWRAMIFDYWMKENKRLDYFQHQVMFRALVKGLPEAAAEFEKMPKVDQTPTHRIWYDWYDRAFDSLELERLASQGYCFQKTTYRFKDAPVPGSFRDYMVNYWKSL